MMLPSKATVARGLLSPKSLPWVVLLISAEFANASRRRCSVTVLHPDCNDESPAHLEQSLRQFSAAGALLMAAS
jgi:hypothetical protein